MKKIIFLVLLIIVLGVSGIYFYNKHTPTNLPSSFNDKVLAARKAVLLFNYATAETFYQAALKQNKTESLNEEYLAFLVARENLKKAAKVANEILKEKPTHFLANLVNSAYYIHANKLDAALVAIKPSGIDDTSFNNTIFAILSSINCFTKRQNDSFNLIGNQIKQQLPNFYYNQLILYNLMMKNYLAAEKVASTAVISYPNVDNIITYSKLTYRNNKKKGIGVFKEYLNDNFLTDASIKSYLENSDGINNITLQTVFSDALYRLTAYAAKSSNLAYIEPDSSLINHIALMVNPNNIISRLANTNYYLSIGDYQTANTNFNKINPNSFYFRLVYPQIVQNLKDLNQQDEAKKLLNIVYKQDKTNPQPLLELGHLYHAEHNDKEAIKYYSKALTVSKHNQQNLGIWLAYYFRGIAYNTNNEWNNAQKDLYAALKINHNDPLLLNYLAYIWLEKDYNINKAAEMIKLALKKDPNNVNIIDSYAWVLFKQGKYQPALKEALIAVKSLPYNSTINDHLGDIYWKLGNKAEAKLYWSAALNTNPSSDITINLQNKVNGKIPKYLS